MRMRRRKRGIIIIRIDNGSPSRAHNGTINGWWRKMERDGWRMRWRHRSQIRYHRRITDCCGRGRGPGEHVIFHKWRLSGPRRMKKRLRLRWHNLLNSRWRWQRNCCCVGTEIAESPIVGAIIYRHAHIAGNMIPFLSDLHARYDGLVSETGRRTRILITRTLVHKLAGHLRWEILGKHNFNKIPSR